MKPLNELTDAELSECFAVEVAGKFAAHWFCPKCNERIESSSVTYEERHDIDCCLSFVHWKTAPDYATSADAVLPWLNKLEWSASKGDDGLFRVTVYAGEEMSTAMDVSFARAACIALIEAKRREWK